MTKTILSVNNISKSFGRYKAIDNVSFNLQKGDIYGLIGSNGAGKTTIMRLITQLSPLKVGEIKLFDQKINQQALKHVGAVIETPAAFNKLTVQENLKLVAIQRGINDTRKITEIIKFVGLTEKIHTKAKDLSLGQRQRLGLAIAILPEPDLLILDEPINGLDPSGIIEFRKLLKKLNQEKQITILISSHILTELYQVSTRFGFIYDGQLIKEITKEELDKANRSGLVLTVDDVSKASKIIDEKFMEKFTVIDDKNILIHSLNVDPSKLNRELVEKGISVISLTKKEKSLEDYYTNLIGGIKNA
ncbi:ABC-type multidrug transport system, ATPase component [Companilactobacillus paralimentarius DSM 13238 = JCM 10415]|uniref:ABC-type multidrug transport system, ATPase component n=2 Tax=Companilactobacillus paralimentarius TaxID=83526 RepID=A0A0R1PRN0_9LACO|nr:ABC transporter ATP-binding protein [Companilactobacillus paralimentarius]KAE9564602.1 ABC transporter [Companilactobacillus paralimentarius]KRL31112.1 ABC-type multidrug transport system, ATPase component [Companilactobacillus paralimentarius DSM 13238 = JCM 10415]